MSHTSPVSLTLDTVEQETLSRLIKETLACSPLYEHEYQALRAVLEKLNEGGARYAQGH